MNNQCKKTIDEYVSRFGLLTPALIKLITTLDVESTNPYVQSLYQIERDCDALHVIAESLGSKDRIDAFGMKELLFVFIDRFRRLARQQEVYSDRLDVYLEQKNKERNTPNG